MNPSPAPYVPPPSEAPCKEIVDLRLSDPFRWLLLGWRDLMAAKGISLFYGVCFLAMAAVLGAVFRSRPEYAMSIASGCLLVGPFLAMGLYEVSRWREQGITPELGASLTCWDSHLRGMGMLVLVLIVLELLWGRASLVVFAVFFNTGMPSTTGMLLTGLVLVALIPWGLGLLIIGPWLGHASWHAYRGSVRWLDEDDAPLVS